MLKTTELHSKKGHERIVHGQDETTNFNGIIAVHNTNLGPALGGCRAMRYPSDDIMLDEVKRLSTAMSYKNSLAGLNRGGGKTVFTTDAPTPDQLKSLAELLNLVNKDGHVYSTAGDMNTGIPQLKELAKHTEFVQVADTEEDSGRSTAYSVYMAMTAATIHMDVDLRTRTVGISGLGKVGSRLGGFLRSNFTKMLLHDNNMEKCNEASVFLGGSVTDSLSYLMDECDVFAPCAVGGVVDASWADTLSEGDIICGGANNVLTDESIAEELKDAGVLFIPDYLANAGGVIFIDDNAKSWIDMGTYKKLHGVLHTTTKVLDTAAEEDKTPLFIANRMAEERFMNV